MHAICMAPYTLRMHIEILIPTTGVTGDSKGEKMVTKFALHGTKETGLSVKGPEWARTASVGSIVVIDITVSKSFVE